MPELELFLSKQDKLGFEFEFCGPWASSFSYVTNSY